MLDPIYSRQTLIPPLLTLGIGLPLALVYADFMTGGEPYEMPILTAWMQIVVGLLAVVCLGLAVLNIKSLKKLLAEKAAARKT